MICTKIFRSLLICSLLAGASLAQGLRMQVELDKPMYLYDFSGTQAMFICEGERSSLFDLSTGKKKYELKQDDYEPKGIHAALGDRFLVSSSDQVNCYDIASGRLLWARGYHDIDQEYFASVVEYGDPLMLLYGGVLLAIDPANGNEVWYQTFKFNAAASFNFKILKKQQKFFALLEDDKIAVYDLKTGKQLGEAEEFEISSTLVEKNYPYCYFSSDERYGAFCLDDQVAVMDFAQNKALGRVEISYDSDIPPLQTTATGCLVVGKNKVVFVNGQTGTLTEAPASVGDFRTYQIMQVGNREVLLAGLKNEMFAIDLTGGKVLWQSKEDDPNFEGYAHRYLRAEGNSLLFTYNNTGFSIGTDLFLMSVDAFTGKVNYKVPVANCKQAIMGLQRTMSKFVANNEGTTNDFGYDNIGFDYSIAEHGGNVVIAIVAPYGMRVPEKRTDGGEGICVVDPKTGKVVFADYLELSEETSVQRVAGDPNVLQPLMEGDRMVLVGNHACAVWDLSAKKRLWRSDKLSESYPVDATVIDNVLYIKFGQLAMHIALSKDAGGLLSDYGLKVEEVYDARPYSIHAYDLASGKRLWDVETKEDPGFTNGGYTMRKAYDAKKKRLYLDDEENVRALQLRRDGGKYDWTYNLEKNGLGKMPTDTRFAIKEFPIGEMGTSYSFSGNALWKTSTPEVGGPAYDAFQEEIKDAYDYMTYTSGGTVWGVAAMECLRFLHVNENTLVIADKGMALVDGAKGTTLWKIAWAYDQDNVDFLPKVIGDKLVYCIDRQLISVSMSNGGKRFQAEESKHPRFIVSPSGKYIVSIDEEGEVIKGYEL